MLTIAKYESKLIQGSLGMSQVSTSQRMRSCAVLRVISSLEMSQDRGVMNALMRSNSGAGR